MKIRVLSVDGQPELECEAQEAAQIDMLVKNKYGQQSNGTPHDWCKLSSGLTVNIKQVVDTVEGNFTGVKIDFL